MKISAVIPIYNAANTIPKSYLRLKSLLNDTGEDYEIIFRDDASRDNSLAILREIAKTNNRVKVFSHTPNRGLGYTLRKLFASSQGDIVIYLDVDLSFDMDVLPDFLEQIKREDIDVILASRYAGHAKEIPFKRELLSRVYYFLSRILFDINVKDIGSGFVVFKKNVLNRIRLSARGFDIHIEIFAKIQEAGFKVKEIPVRYVHDHIAGTFSVLKHGPAVLLGTLKLWWSVNIPRHES